MKCVFCLQGLIEIEQDVLTTTMGVFLSDEDDVELGEDEEEDDFPAIDTLSLTAAEESSVGRKGSGTQRREEEDVAELLQSEDAQKVKQQLTALLEESRQLSAALAQWQAAKEAADLQVECRIGSLHGSANFVSGRTSVLVS